MNRLNLLHILSLPLAAALMLTPPAAISAATQERLNARELIELARTEPNSARLRDALITTLGAGPVERGTAHTSIGPDFVWAIRAEKQPTLVVDDTPQPPMKRLEGSDLWYAIGKLRVGWSHAYYYLVEGQRVGGNGNVPCYGPDSYEQPDVPRGTLSSRITHTSKIYDGMVCDYWVYLPAGHNSNTPACVMVWNDGGQHVDRNSPGRTQVVIDNLTHKKLIPMTVHIFINPGDISGAAGTPTHDFVSDFSRKTGRTLKDSMRSTQYDTVTDRYARFLRDEIIAEVAKKHALRSDGYSRAIAGESSGAIAAFNAAWQMPDEFSRVLSRIGTYTSIQWIPGKLDGGNIFPFALRKTPRKQIRVWLSDGSEDLENQHGSWPLQNVQMANSLKMAGYDFHFRWSNQSHSGSQGAAEAPEALAWLWRDYNPDNRAAIYVQDPAEKDRPYFRIRALNRDE